MSITSEQQSNILGVIVGLFNASPGIKFLADITRVIESGTTEAQLADTLAADPLFTNDIMGGKTPAAQVTELMNHYGLVADNIAGSPASQAEAFFTASVNAGVGFGAIAIQATTFLLGSAVPAEFTETANLLKNKIKVAEIHSTSVSFSTDLAILQAPLLGLSGATLLTQAEATNFLATNGFLFRVNAASVALNDATIGPLAGPVGIIDVPDVFSVNIISTGLNFGAFDIGAGFSVTPLDATGTTADGNAETFTLNASPDINGINAHVVIVNGVENLVILSTVDGSIPDDPFSTAYTLTARFIAPDAETITITGNGGVDLEPNPSVINEMTLKEMTIGKVSVINAAGSTGNITINFTGHAQSVSYTGSSGVDAYLGSTQGDIISGGQGNDFLILESAKAARDVLVLNGATDSQIRDGGGDGRVDIHNDFLVERVQYFTVGGASTADRVDVSSAGFTGAQRGIVDVSVKVSEFTDLTGIPDLFSDTAGDRGVAFLELSLGGISTTILLVDVNKDGNLTAADDIVLELMGAGPLSVDNFIF